MRTLALGLGVVLTAALVPTASPLAATAQACTARTLVLWLDTNRSGAAGSTYYKLGFTNLSGGRCTLAGYPGVSAVGLDGRRLGSPAGRDPQTRPRTVTLTPGRTATAVLQIADVDVFPEAACRPVTAAGLRVVPPNQTRSKLVPFPFRACSRAGPTYLHVRTVTADP